MLFGVSISDSKDNYLPIASGDDNENSFNSASEPREFLKTFRCRRDGRSNTCPAIAAAVTLTVLLTILFGTFMTFILAKFSILSISIVNPHPKILVSPCGSTATEARAHGCHFDLISFCWLPDACYDAELSNAFDNITEWEWFLDSNRTQQITHEQIMTGEYTGLYVNWEYHLTHCTAMWKKLHRAVLGKGKGAIDDYLGRMEHTEHCEHMLLSDRDTALDKFNTVIRVKYPDCGIQ